ncbi:MAG: hypothetical protein K9K37_08950 [Desulfocapsa sp.]|nr:hypothetical protein [Desulfocapsa sp.]
MKKFLTIVGLVSLVAATGVYANPANSDKGDSQSYTAIVPSMAAIAEWVADFTTSYNENGIYQAVAEIFKEGVTPEEAFPQIINVEGVNPQNLVAAAYCAGAKHEDIRSASESVGIPEMIVVAGWETAKTVCGEEIAATQAYTPLGPGYSGVPAGTTTSHSYGSPSGFVNPL